MNRWQHHTALANPVPLVMLVILASTGVLVSMAPVVHAQPGECPAISYSSEPHYEAVSLTLTLSAAAGSSSIGPGNYFLISGTAMGVPCTAEATAAITPIYLDNSTTVTVSAQSSGSNSNEEWCISGPPGICTSQVYQLGNAASASIGYTYYEQFDNPVSYTVSGGGSGYSSPTFTCLQFGSAFFYIATPEPTGVWTDAGCTYAFSNPLGGSGSSERWEASSGTFGVIAGASSLSPVYYNQFLLSFSYSLVGGGAPGAPAITSTQFGSSGSASLTTSTQDIWLDSGAPWSASNPTPGSTSVERWEASGVTSGTVSASSAYSFIYYHQYYVQFSYSVTGGGSGYSPPLITYGSLGGNAQATLTTPGSEYWVDAGSSWSASGQLQGSSNSERWSAMVSSGSVNSQASVTLSYYHQYLVTVSSLVEGGGTGYTPPSLTFQSYGSSTSAALGVPSSSFWVDAGGSWSTNNPLLGSTLEERWDTNATTAGTALAPATLSFTYFHQFYVTFGYSVLGGGTAYSTPTVQITQFGAQVSAFGGWTDAGSHYSYTNPLIGSSSTERWFTGSAGGLVQSSLSVNATYYRQYDFVLSYTVIGATIQLSPPILNSTSLGLPHSEQLQGQPADYWLDSGTKWVLSTALPGSGKTERWMTGQTAEGTVRASSTMAFAYFDQYAAGFSYSIRSGGSPQPPSLRYTSFSVPVNATISNSRVVYWLDSHSTWSLTNPIPGQSNSERWVAAQGTSGTALGPFNETATYVHQYYVQVETNSKEGGVAEASSGWYDNGSSLPLNASAFIGWRFSGWSGAGKGSYSGTILNETVPIGSAINETAVFYAGLILTSGTGGSIHYGYGHVNGDVQGGSNATLYVVPGTRVNLSSSPVTVAFAFRGWSGNLTGAVQNSSLTVTAPMGVSATFGLDYTDIGIFYGVTVAITVLTVYVFIVRRRHDIFGSGQLISSVNCLPALSRFSGYDGNLRAWRAPDG